jgi:hypothetical protein
MISQLLRELNTHRILGTGNGRIKKLGRYLDYTLPKIKMYQNKYSTGNHKYYWHGEQTLIKVEHPNNSVYITPHSNMYYEIQFILKSSDKVTDEFVTDILYIYFKLGTWR